MEIIAHWIKLGRFEILDVESSAGTRIRENRCKTDPLCPSDSQSLPWYERLATEAVV